MICTVLLQFAGNIEHKLKLRFAQMLACAKRWVYITFTFCATQQAQTNMRKLMCRLVGANLNHDLRRAVAICVKHLMQTEVEICADISMCREMSANYLRRQVGADAIHNLCRLAGADQSAQIYV